MKPDHATTRQPNRRRQAFTLIELVLVLTIISILVGGAVYYMMGNVDVAKETKAETDIKNISTQLQLYESQNLRPPSTEQGLQALVTQPTSEPLPPKWRALMEELPQDPWGNAYQYKYPAERSKKAYDIFSWGPDGKESADDIGNWKRTPATDTSS